MKDIWIHSVGRRIPMDEYLRYYYKVGHAYQLNPNYYHKCVKEISLGADMVEHLFILHDRHSIQIGVGETDAMPSLDMVNKMLDGSMREFPVEQYDFLREQIIASKNALVEQCENIKTIGAEIPTSEFKYGAEDGAYRNGNGYFFNVRRDSLSDIKAEVLVAAKNTDHGFYVYPNVDLSEIDDYSTMFDEPIIPISIEAYNELRTKIFCFATAISESRKTM